MKILIIAAMQKELELILQQLPEPQEETIGDLKLYRCSGAEHEFIVAKCGIGKVEAAIRTWMLIDLCNPDIVINTGVAGALDKSLSIGDVLIADRVCYHDVWCGPGTEYGQADRCPLYFQPSLDGLRLLRVIADDHELRYRFGLLCSGDKFISKSSEVEEIKNHFPEALGCDMESASISQVCFRKKVPFLIIRVLSDMPGGGANNIEEYNNFWQEAPERTFKALFNLIERL